YEQIKANRATREAFAVEVNARRAEFLAGRKTIEVALEAQRFWADALANEYQAVVAYNNALAGFEFAKGTILQHDNVVIAEGQLRVCASVGAVEHERQRTAALVLRQRALPTGRGGACAGCSPADVMQAGGPVPAPPVMPEAVGRGASLPAFLA